MTRPVDSTAVHPLLMGVLRGAAPSALRPLLPEPDGWAPILDDAVRHGLIPLLSRWLKTADLGSPLPPRLAERLDADVLGTAARNLLLSAELAGILRAFEDERLPCVPVRGPALAEQLYGDVTARPMGDLDLLVRRDDLARAAAALERLGFRRLDRRPGFAELFSYTLVFVKERHGWIVVEPHWTIAYPPFADGVDMAAVWQRCARGRVVGVETWRLGREDLLLHLGLHLMHPDDGAPLLWFYELDRLLRAERGRVDWSRFVATAETAGVECLLADGLGQVKTLFGTPIPEDVLRRLRGRPPRRHQHGLGRGLTAAAGAAGREELALFFTVKGVRLKLRYALGLLFPCPRYMRIQYGVTGARGLACAYARRCCRLSWAGLKGTARLLGLGARPRPAAPGTQPTG